MDATVLFCNNSLPQGQSPSSSNMPRRTTMRQFPMRKVNLRGLQWICKAEDQSSDSKATEAQPLSPGFQDLDSAAAGDAEAEAFQQGNAGASVPGPATPPIPTRSYLQRRATYHKQLMAKKLSIAKEQVAAFMGPRDKGDIRDVILMSLSFAVLVYISQRLVCAYCLLRSMAQHF